MKSAFMVVAVLALAGGAFAAGCASTPEYVSYLELACRGNELSFNWPNYKNISQFYTCQGLGRPLLLSCGPDTYFSYVLQGCQNCNDYIPSQPCATLKIDKASSCQPMNGGSTKPTTAGTGTTASTQKTTKPPTTPTQSSSKSTTPNSQTTAFPPAPSPSTINPDVPIPPTAAPTPPPVEAKPPNVVVPTN